MENYKVKVSSTVEKALKKMPKKDLLNILESIKLLSINPFPVGFRKLVGEENVFRLRQGKYRIIYEVDGKKVFIIILKIGHRKDIYKK